MFSIMLQFSLLLHSNNRIVTLTSGVLFEFQMCEHIKCMGRDLIVFSAVLVEDAKTIFPLQMHH